MADPVLVLVAHGTAVAAARSAVGALTAAVRDRLPGVEVRLAHVDVQNPALAGVMADVRARDGRAVVVPLLLAAGYHVEVDIAAAVDPARDVVTPTLAGESAVVDVEVDRLRADGGERLDAVVVAATGSSRAGARAQVAAHAAAVATALGLPATVGWAAAGEPDVGAAVGAARAAGADRVGVVTHLLAPGVFARRADAAARAAGAVAVGAPVLPDPRIADVVVRRFRHVG